MAAVGLGGPARQSGRRPMAEDKGHAVLEQALKAAVESNSKLAEQVTAQRKEIERLRSLTWA